MLINKKIIRARKGFPSPSCYNLYMSSGKSSHNFVTLMQIRNVLLIAPLLLFGAEIMLLKEWLKAAQSFWLMPSMKVYLGILCIHLMALIYPAGRLVATKPSDKASMYLIVVYGLGIFLNISWAQTPEIPFRYILFAEIITIGCFMLAFQSYRLIGKLKHTK